jgi:probable phosphoglycerate mutase
MTTHIIRHGETEHNVQRLVQGWLDSPLTEKGRTYAVETAKSIDLQNEPIVISSDLGRALSTAQIIRETLGIKKDIIADPNMRERNCGEYEGKHIDKLYDLIASQGYERNPEGIYLADVKGLESIGDIKKRVSKVQTTNKNRDLIIVGHCLSNNYLREIDNPENFQFYSGREIVTL